MNWEIIVGLALLGLIVDNGLTNIANAFIKIRNYWINKDNQEAAKGGYGKQALPVTEQATPKPPRKGLKKGDDED
jgi:hypothetical protein